MANYQPALDMIEEMKRAYNADAPMAALSLAFVAIDSMAWTSMPLGATQDSRKEFIAWVDKYLKASPTSTYTYAGLDVYAARCAVLHSYGSFADLHSKANPPVVFGYRVGGGDHLFDAAENFALISIGALIEDLADAIGRYLVDARIDTDLRARIESRIEKLFVIRHVPD